MVHTKGLTMENIQHIIFIHYFTVRQNKWVQHWNQKGHRKFFQVYACSVSQCSTPTIFYQPVLGARRYYIYYSLVLHNEYNVQFDKPRWSTEACISGGFRTRRQVNMYSDTVHISISVLEQLIFQIQRLYFGRNTRLGLFQHTVLVS